ncbi:rhodanese-like domain-containing protein [Aureibacter tunicatorum]|uniref:Rhodanese-related sulfurtransferase n=1 Tax=Aureibacter tunicatorum TaxID=866807 RepID=A0AAE3XNQ4_9BACT|nr:rhodanese-like domain-containing protein [Aureibacter tunicatorum]MDR6239116.1 rhodanese-related sulfurtransferase [Aureibacter tunicatorum]BDD04958.1 hypothetical protein AUTU_24410 [Aureibacter tunicatorum]
MKEISALELKEMIDNQEEFQLIDVREPNEYEFTNIGGTLIPLGTVLEDKDKISKDETVVVMCRSGKRSAQAIMALEQLGYDNLFNLKGGILEYGDQVDDEVKQY